MKRLALTLAMLVPALARADAPPDVTALFEQGLEDMKANKLDVACKEMAAALAKYDDSGIRGALATCYTKSGKTASAWSMWKNLADTAKPEDRADALSRAKALEPLLARYQIKIAGKPPDGLVVTINGQAVAEPTLSVAVPVDPGAFEVIANAPGKAEFRATLQATNAKTTVVEIPVLKGAGSGATVVKPQDPGAGPSTAVPEKQPPPPGQKRYVAAYVLGGAGILGFAAGTVLGLSASSQLSDAKKTCGGSLDQCNNVADAQTQVNDARATANISTVAFIAGGALVVTGVVLYVTAPKHHKEKATAMRLVPAMGPGQAGITLSGGW